MVEALTSGGRTPIVITLLHESSPSTVALYRRELLESNVASLVGLASSWTDATINAPTDLALLKTFWCELRGTRRSDGEPFLVGEVAAAIEARTLFREAL